MSMKILGLLLAVGGWLIPVAGLALTTSVAIRLVLCLVGIALWGVGIFGCVNPAYVKDAVWKR
jgi:hypothetical protein